MHNDHSNALTKANALRDELVAGLMNDEEM